MLALAQPWILGLVLAALRSFWPMWRASNPCHSTWSQRSLLRKVFAPPGGGHGDEFSSRAHRWPFTGVLGDLASTGCRPFGDILAQIAGGVSSGVGVHHRCRRTLPLAELTTWRSLLLVGDPRCTTFLGAALMPVANGNLAHPRITEEDCTCSASLASQLSCPARLSRSVAAHFRRRGHELQQNLSRLEREKQVASAQPRLPGICTFFFLSPFLSPPRPGILALSMSRNVIFPVFCAPKLVRVHFFFSWSPRLSRCTFFWPSCRDSFVVTRSGPPRPSLLQTEAQEMTRHPPTFFRFGRVCGAVSCGDGLERHIC